MAERILNTKTEKILWATPHKIYAQIGTSTNGQTFNKNIATAEKSPIFTSHKSYKIPLPTIPKKNMKKITLSLFILFTSIIYSQKGDAILILKDSSTIKGSGEISGILSKVAINFGNDSLKFRTYRSKEIIGIDILENSYYRKFRFKYVDKDKFPEILEIITIDSLSLYCRIYDGQNLMMGLPKNNQSYTNEHPIESNNSVKLSNGAVINMQPSRNSYFEIIIPRISYYVGKFENDRVEHLYTKGLPFAMSFEKSISKYFNDCESLVKKVKSKEFSNDNIQEIIDYYKNNCNN